MANLKEIRGRIKSVKTTQQMTRAMKMVAAAKLRRAQDKILNLRPYAQKLREIMLDVRSNMPEEEFESPYAVARKPEKVLLVVVTSNRGLAGAFNSSVIKYTQQIIEEQYQAQRDADQLELLCIGKKGFEFFDRRGYSVIERKNFDLFSKLTFEAVADVSEMVMQGFVDGRWDRVDLVFNTFKNVLTQVKTQEQFLPLPSVSDDAGEGEGEQHGFANYIFEPDQEQILSDLIPRGLKISFFRAILESNAGEQGARMTAMDNATENAEELLKSLKLTYNQARQAAITTEILEIVAGADALASGG